MAQSINHRSDFVTQGTAFTGFNEYGQIMVGDEGFEFFSDRNPNRCIQIPWSNVEVILASILFHGRWIPRIGLRTTHDGTFMFAARDPKKLLKACSAYIPADRIYRSWTFFEVVKKNIQRRHKKKS